MIVAANISDAKELTEIAIKSKAFWGYSRKLIDSWTDDLTITDKIINTMYVYNFIEKNMIVGFYVLNEPSNNNVELEFLFVLPKFIGKGFGKELLLHAFKKAKKLNCISITLLADPNAIKFYSLHGFYQIGKKDSSIPGRFLPILKKDF